MKRIVLGAAVALLGAMLVATEVEARRVGGGRTLGAQRNLTNAPPAQAPAKPAQQQTQQVAPRQQPAAQPGAAPAAGQPAPASGLSRWMPMLGGLALGGLLGSLFAGSGFGAALMGILTVALLALGVLAVVRMLAAKRGDAPRPVQFAGLGNETVAAPPPSQAAGLDAPAARAAPDAAVAARIPEGFDSAGFLRGAKLNFMKLQLANDTGNLDELREFTTPELYEDLAREVRERGGARQQTDIMALNADLLEVVTEGDRHWASVRFSGSVRETPGSAPEGFEEVWNLAKPVDGSSGWLLAGIQQMH
jgi:predicted lipid-binding transport protein (Tim44 family)